MSTQTTPESTRAERVRKDIERITIFHRDLSARLANTTAAIRADDRYADGFKQTQVETARAALQAEAKAEAKRAWSNLNVHSDSAAQDAAAAARDADSGFDFHKISALGADYAAQLAAPPDPGYPGSNPVVDRAHALLKEVQSSGDSNATRAWRIAAAPALVGHARGEGTDAALARAMLGAASEILKTERGDAPRHEAEHAAIEGARLHLRSAILSPEKAAGVPAGPAGPFGPTRWQTEVLGESPSDTGGGVWIGGQPASGV